MFIKVLLNLIIICCSSMLGNQIANRYLFRLKEIRILQVCLAKLETEIIYYSTFLPEALDNVGKSTKGVIGRFLCDVSKNLTDKRVDGIDAAWELALDKNRLDLKFTNDDYEVIRGFGCQLGIVDRTSQKQLFELAQLQLKKQEQKAEEERDRYEKMYRSLGFLTGLTIVIILF